METPDPNQSTPTKVNAQVTAEIQALRTRAAAEHSAALEEARAVLSSLEQDVKGLIATVKTDPRALDQALAWLEGDVEVQDALAALDKAVKKQREVGDPAALAALKSAREAEAQGYRAEVEKREAAEKELAAIEIEIEQDNRREYALEAKQRLLEEIIAEHKQIADQLIDNLRQVAAKIGLNENIVVDEIERSAKGRANRLFPKED